MDASDEQWQHAYETVFLAAVRLTRAVGAGHGDGRCHRTRAVDLGTSPLPGLAICNGLRPGLAMYVKTLADELGPRGVRVLSLLPGRLDTPRLRALGGAGEPNVDDIPLRRLGAPGGVRSHCRLPAVPCRVLPDRAGRSRRRRAGAHGLARTVGGGRYRPDMDWKLEVLALPVTDVDRAKAFYVDQVGFHADHDHRVPETCASSS